MSITPLQSRRTAARRLPPLDCGHRDPLDCRGTRRDPDPCSRVCWTWGLVELRDIAATVGRCPCGGDER